MVFPMLLVIYSQHCMQAAMFIEPYAELLHIRFGRKHNKVGDDVEESPRGYNNACHIDCMLATCAAWFAAPKQTHTTLLALPYCCVSIKPNSWRTRAVAVWLEEHNV